MAHNIPVSPISPRRKVLEDIGTEPGDRYTQLLHRTCSRPSSRPRVSSIVEPNLENRQDIDTVPTSLVGEMDVPGIVETIRTSNGQSEINGHSTFHTPNPIERPIHISVLPFGPSRRRSSLATTSTNISTPPPMYTGYVSLRTPVTESIVQNAQFDDPLQTQESERRQTHYPSGTLDSGLRHRSAYSAYYTSPLVPPQPVMGTGPSPGFFDIHGYIPGRTNMIQPHVQLEDWDDEEEEKHRLANYHARMDWGPDDEYDDPEPSVAARRPYGDTSLPGYRPSGDVGYPLSPKSDWSSRSQTIITVGSETGRKHFITENICPLEQRRSFILVLAKALLQFQAPSHRMENQLEAAARVLDVPAEFLHLPSLVIASFGSLDGEQGAPVADKTRKFSFSSNKLKSAIAVAVLGKNKEGTRNHQDSECEVLESEPRQEESAHATAFGIRVHIVKSGGKMELGKLHELHTIYRKVVHDELSAQDGRIKLLKLLKQPPIYKQVSQLHLDRC